MSGIKSKQFNLKNAFSGTPTNENFEVVDFDLPEIKDGEFLVEVQYLTVDPYMRLPGVAQVGGKMPGEGVAKVVQSKNEKFPVGSMVFGGTGWATHAVGDDKYRVLPDNIPQMSHFLGVLGMPGLTAYLELEVLKAKEGETFFVNASAGAVGSIVGQMAKARGCRVVGCAGSDQKIAYLKEIGFDVAFNYKSIDLAQALKEACPNGIDCFVDHVGGKQFDIAMDLMNYNGRIVIVGSISNYNATEVPKGPYIHMNSIRKELTISGLGVFAHYHRFPQFIQETNELINQGKIKISEHTYNGFEKMVEAFLSIFKGSHIGKIVVKL